ncbi:OsmC family protein [Schaalia sp. Marseille-Q2122]|uniref:OsmC family protein n=1 Tax=Schaalia sp. Marseille-Q2122 TaxID=2736604 RepID=UPI00158BB9BB|nr:OsmC family protein [Schaalia sp. Marseille-Q2122]
MAMLYLERVGTRRYVARNARGAEVAIGSGEGEFSPGDLLKLALAGCNAMSSDVRMQGALGEDFAQITTVGGEYNEDADQFESFTVELIQDMSSLSEDEKAALLRRAEGAINRNCTIAHTLAKATPYTHVFTSEQVAE